MAVELKLLIRHKGKLATGTERRQSPRRMVLLNCRQSEQGKEHQHQLEHHQERPVIGQLSVAKRSAWRDTGTAVSIQLTSKPVIACK